MSGGRGLVGLGCSERLVRLESLERLVELGCLERLVGLGWSLKTLVGVGGASG